MASLKSITVEDLQNVLLSVKSPKTVLDRETGFPILGPKYDNDPKIRKPETVADVYKLQEAIENSMTEVADEVYPNVYIGNFKSLMNPDYLKSIGITHVLNAAEGFTVGNIRPDSIPKEIKSDFKYSGLMISDTKAQGDPKTLGMFEEAANVLETAIDIDKGKIMVNCFGGISRSATSVLSYLILKKNYSADEAVKVVKAKRDVRPSNECLCYLANMSNRKLGIPEVTVDHIEMDPMRLRLKKIFAQIDNAKK